MRVPRSSRPLVVLGDTQALGGIWALAAVAMFVAAAAAAGALDLRLHQTIQLTWLGAAIGLVGAVIAHELVHVLAVVVVRGRARLLAGWRGLPYVHVASATRLARNRALVTMLAPFLLVGLAGVALLIEPATSAIGLIVVIVNSMGSVPDLWRASQLLRLPAWVECEERGATLQVWAPADRNLEAAELRLSAGRGGSAAVGAIGTWLLCLLVAEALVATGVRVLAQYAGSVSIGSLSLASTEQFVAGPEVVLNLWPVLGLGALLGTVVAAVWITIALRAQRAVRGGRTPTQRRLPA